MNKKIIFIDLDGTLIETYSGATFPKGIWDMKIKFDVWDMLRDIQPDYIFIVTNQGGIGKFTTELLVEVKLDYITEALGEYVTLKSATNSIKVDSIYCPSMDKDNEYRKPNIGMLEHVVELYNLKENYTKTDMLMVGDASGKPEQFSDSDLKTAENYKIDYLDVNDFINL